MSSVKYHNFHLVNPSPWPLITSFGSFGVTYGSVLILHFFEKGLQIFSYGSSLFFSGIMCWWRDVVREATFEGHHTKIVQQGLKIGMVLFIISEVMFFFSFFWAYFHSSLSPSIVLGSVWPPRGIDAFRPWGIPLLNTIVLLSSGLTITWVHLSILIDKFKDGIESFLYTLTLAILFTVLQLYEYTEAKFNISDSVYGSIFFMSTGFHGFHVIVGTIFILVCFIRYLKKHFTKKRHLGFECAAWYWHFVDVVWLFLYIAVYYWGNEVKFKIFFFSSDNLLFNFVDDITFFLLL